ncbi:MAG: DUF2461 domain-containing protein [Nitrospinae bacterium]|nr:DUF2461 domain-containing protein [Nitrospinota bacterium]
MEPISPDPATFALPKGTVAFFRSLAANNNRAWFDEHRDDYRAQVVAPAMALTTLLGEAFENRVEKLRYEPRVDGSIFRLNRDVRFSKEKSPYKTNLGVFVWCGAGKKMDSAGLYFHLSPDEIFVGSGIYRVPPEKLDRFRRFVDAKGKLLADAVETAERQKFALEGETTVRVPKGFPADHPHARFLRHKGFYLSKSLPVSAATKKGFGAKLIRELEPTVPFLNLLAKGLG